jgi:protein gp37
VPTTIEWTDETWNPVRGCSRVSPGCLNCYAERIAARFSDEGQPFHLFAERKPKPHWTGKVGLVEDHLTDPLHWKKPRRVFVNSMSDLFHEDLSYVDLLSVFCVMGQCPRHTFQILTKRPERMLEFLKDRRWRNLGHSPAMGGDHYVAIIPGEHRESDARFLPNVWLGVSIENKAALERLYDLGRTPAAKRFISYEPALEAVGDFRLPHFACNMGLPNPDWIIVGGESGPNARPFDIQWARDTIEVCKLGRIACFVKQLGAMPFERKTFYPFSGAPQIGDSYLNLKDPKGGDWDEWPEDLRVREFPEDRQRRTHIPPAPAGGNA